MSDPIPSLNSALEGRYRVERALGEGGMATVYLAEVSVTSAKSRSRCIPNTAEPFPGAALHPDGDRFVLAIGSRPSQTPPGSGTSRLERVILIENFFEELRERLTN